MTTGFRAYVRVRGPIAATCGPRLQVQRAIDRASRRVIDPIARVCASRLYALPYARRSADFLHLFPLFRERESEREGEKARAMFGNYRTVV